MAGLQIRPNSEGAAAKEHSLPLKGDGGLGGGFSSLVEAERGAFRQKKSTIL